MFLAFRLYLRFSSIWMLVSGRKSTGARLAGRSRLANIRDRMRMEIKSFARKGRYIRRGWGLGGIFIVGVFRVLGKSCFFYGRGVFRGSG